MLRAKLFIPGFLIVLFSCSGPADRPAGIEKIRTDALGRAVSIPTEIKKVMGLSPALTEMLFALLPDSAIAAVSIQCDYPPRQVETKTKVNTYPLDIEALLVLKPDLIFTETGISSPADVARMEKAGLKVFVFDYQKVWDIPEAMDSIRTWVQPKVGTDRLMDSLYAELRFLEKRASESIKQNRPKILAITWTDPVFAYGYNTCMTDKMRLAGGINGLEEKLDKPYPQLSREYILKINPDVIFGGNFEKMEASFFKLYPELKLTIAYRNKWVFELNDDLASRPGPRFLEGIREIEQKLNLVR
jgi:iron complex transport system substrate-binding protein